jgi:hypothetical protein
MEDHGDGTQGSVGSESDEVIPEGRRVPLFDPFAIA